MQYVLRGEDLRLILLSGVLNMKDYKINTICTYRYSSNHYAYIAYAILEGPHGGKIFVDEFNLENLVYNFACKNDRNDILSDRLDNYIISYGRRFNLINEIVPESTWNDAMVVSTARQLGFKSTNSIIRKSNRRLYNIIRYRLSLIQ